MNLFRLSFLFIVLAELVSFFGYFMEPVNIIGFFVILFLTLVLSLKDLKWGLYIIIVDLLINSKGYLFYLPWSGVNLSLRMGLFLVVLAVWFVHLLYSSAPKAHPPLAESRGREAAGVEKFTLKKKLNFILRACREDKFWVLFFVFIAWGIINGFIRGNSSFNILFDVNGYFYFALLPVFFTVIKNWKIVKEILTVASAAIATQIIKAAVLSFSFSHDFISAATPAIYNWVKETGVGEISLVGANFYRIFFQSHIYVLIGVFIVLALLTMSLRGRYPVIPSPEGTKQSDAKRHPERSPSASLRINSAESRDLTHSEKGEISPLVLDAARRDSVEMTSRIAAPRFAWLAMTAGLLFIILIGFSRSFWAGFLAGLFVFFGWLIYQRTSWRVILKSGGITIISGVVALGLIYSIVNFPYPKPPAWFSPDLLKERMQDLSKGEAASSRWNLLPELWGKIKECPLLGCGFGAEVTYISRDPRNVGHTAGGTGVYTTYAFEWGYLDIWLKLGLLGLLAYLALICQLFWRGIKMANSKWQIANGQGYLILGMMVGLVALLVTNVFSPYLNHPLGIGYIMFLSAVLNINKE